MATVNERRKKIYAPTINGVDAGGAMSMTLNYGYDGVYRSSPDGLGGPPLLDREIEFCRGTLITQDWIEAINLLTGAVGTYVCSERISGVAAATGYTLHTITAPVVHRMSLNYAKGQYSTISLDFECKAADETKGFAAMYAATDSQAAPTYLTAARGGYRIATAAHGATSIYHVMGLNLSIALPLVRECNDGDVGYTAVDAEDDNMAINGSITFQDRSVTATEVLGVTLAEAARGSLVLSVVQGAAGAAKTVTIAGVVFTGGGDNLDVNSPFNATTLNFDVSNDTTTILSLAGDNKILTIV